MSKDEDSEWFDKFTLSLGDGIQETVIDTDMVKIPEDMYIKINPNTAEDPEAEKKSISK